MGLEVTWYRGDQELQRDDPDATETDEELFDIEATLRVAGEDMVEGVLFRCKLTLTVRTETFTREASVAVSTGGECQGWSWGPAVPCLLEPTPTDRHCLKALQEGDSTPCRAALPVPCPRCCAGGAALLLLPAQGCCARGGEAARAGRGGIATGITRGTGTATALRLPGPLCVCSCGRAAGSRGHLHGEPPHHNNHDGEPQHHQACAHHGAVPRAG